MQPGPAANRNWYGSEGADAWWSWRSSWCYTSNSGCIPSGSGSADKERADMEGGKCDEMESVCYGRRMENGWRGSTDGSTGAEQASLDWLGSDLGRAYYRWSRAGVWRHFLLARDLAARASDGKENAAACITWRKVAASITLSFSSGWNCQKLDELPGKNNIFSNFKILIFELCTCLSFVYMKLSQIIREIWAMFWRTSSREHFIFFREKSISTPQKNLNINIYL